MNFKSFPPPPVSGDPIIRCPRCSHEMRLTESLAGPFVEKLKARLKERADENQSLIDAEREALRRESEQVQQARLEIDDEVARRLAAERPVLAAAEARKAQEAAEIERSEREREISELREMIRENDLKMADAQRSQVDALRMQRELDVARAELDLTVEKRTQACLAEIRAAARRDADEAAHLRVADRDRTIEAMARTIEELKRQAEQGSQRRQGEVMELELEKELKAKFPSDSVEPIGNGEPGADIMQQVNGAVGRSAGLMIWESKRTKTWNDGWLAKVRDDQRRCGADVAIIVTQTLPRRIEHFDLMEGVWVCHPRYAIPVCIALRQAIVEVDVARVAHQGHASKAEQLYGYLTGNTFRQRVAALIERYDEMRADLDRERKFIARQWARRETQIASCVEITVATIGDLQGIAGGTMEALAHHDDGSPIPSEVKADAYKDI